jgi:hypothetical protein
MIEANRASAGESLNAVINKLGLGPRLGSSSVKVSSARAPRKGLRAAAGTGKTRTTTGRCAFRDTTKGSTLSGAKSGVTRIRSVNVSNCFRASGSAKKGACCGREAHRRTSSPRKRSRQARSLVDRPRPLLGEQIAACQLPPTEQLARQSLRAWRPQSGVAKATLWHACPESPNGPSWIVL